MCVSCGAVAAVLTRRALLAATHTQTCVQAALHVQEYALLATSNRHRAILLRGTHGKATGPSTARLPAIVAFESCFYIAAALLSVLAHASPCAEPG